MTAQRNIEPIGRAICEILNGEAGSIRKFGFALFVFEAGADKVHIDCTSNLEQGELEHMIEHISSSPIDHIEVADDARIIMPGETTH